MITTDLEVPGRALAVGAHADDIEFGSGATLAKWAGAGCEVHLLVLTDGSKGSWDPDEDIDALVATRQLEARAAAGELGAADVHFLNEPDGALGGGLVERARVCRVIRQVRPDVVLGHDPWKRYRLHPDHHHAGLLTVDAVVAARDPHFHADQQLGAHRPAALLLFEAQDIDHVESVTGYVDRKIAALLCHRSQWRNTMRIRDRPDDERDAFTSRIRDEATEAGALAGLAAGEAYKRISSL